MSEQRNNEKQGIIGIQDLDAGQSCLVATYRFSVTKNLLVRHSVCGVSRIPEEPMTLEQTAEEMSSVLVREKDKETILSILNPQFLKGSFLTGNRQINYNYLVATENNGLRWHGGRLTLYEELDSNELMAYLYVADVDSNYKDKLALSAAMWNMMDFIGCIDVVKKSVRVIRRHNSMLDISDRTMFDYQADLDAFIDSFVVDEDKVMVHKMMQLDNVINTAERFGEFTCSFRLVDPATDRICYKKLSISYLIPEDKSTLMIVQRDLTEVYEESRKQQIALTQALSQAEEAVKVKNGFMSHMSHEIRTPLNTVVGLTELAKSRLDDRDYMQYCLEKIDASSKFLLDMINDILDINNLENDNIQLRAEPVLFAPFIKGIIERNRAHAYNKKINFQIEVDASIAECLVFDEARVRQVFDSMLSNAVKFTPRFGTVKLVTRLVEERMGIQGLEIIVSDTGVGIDDKFKSKVFEPFAQEHVGNTTVYGGAGLGLAICHKIVRDMGGTIDFVSEKGQGSKFRVYVELPVENAPDSAGDVQPEYNFTGHRVLLAEDNEINCEITKEILQRRGISVDIAGNGKEAVSQYMSNAPGTYDLILMDVRMPYMDGLTATKMIRTSGKSDCKAIPIFALTANAFDDDIRKSIEAGMNAHLTKPIDVQVLYRAIRMAFDGNLPA